MKRAKKLSSKFNKSIIAQKQSRKTISIKKIARKTSIERKKVVKKYQTKRVDKATNFDDELKFFNETFVLLINKTIKALREIRRMQTSTNLIIS
jgi:GH15 family glucan-1,4-alpha-glucosidase